MARAITAKFEEMVLEMETDTPGTYVKICGLTDVTVNRTANVDETEIPDCDDESLPNAIELAVSSIDVTVSATGVWAQTSHEALMDWFYGGQTKKIRLKNTKAAVGDTEIEAGDALILSLNNSRTKGQKVAAEVEIRFAAAPTRTAKSA